MVSLRGSMFAAVLLQLFGCGGNRDGSETASVLPQDAEIELALRSQIEVAGLSGDPAKASGLGPVIPYQDPLAKLGQILFFSQSLSGGFDVACASCHLPSKGGSDGLSLSVGVTPEDRRVVGLGRRLDVTRDRDPRADGGPNMHRNSLSTFNAALLNQSLMSDGRIRTSPDQPVVAGAHGLLIQTPQTGIGVELSGASGLLEVMVPLALTNNNEMRGFLFTDLTTPESYRERILQRLRGQADLVYLRDDSPENWLQLFREALDQPSASADQLVTLLNVQRGLAAYMTGQIFVDTPWRDYVAGDSEAISDQAKQGALLFLAPPNEGGLGCARCHTGDRLTDEQFYNVGFPQIGRGFERADGSDAGRWMVTRSADDWFAHKTPGLLNVALTAPYGHAGTFPTLASLLRYHANPRAAFDDFDFSLQQLAQFAGSEQVYPDARQLTAQVIGRASFAAAEQHLPRRWLSTEDEQALVTFLETLTDRCAAAVECIKQWSPAASEDPDGHLLTADNGLAPNITEDNTSNDPLQRGSVTLEWPPLSTRTTFPDVVACGNGLTISANENRKYFQRRDAALGLTASHGFDFATWWSDSLSGLQFSMIAGGLTSAYLNADCWPDIVMTGGDYSGMVAYVNSGNQHGFQNRSDLLSGSQPAADYRLFTSVGAVDLNGDYRRELVYGNLFAGDVIIKSLTEYGVYREVARLPMTRNTYGLSFGDFDADGVSDMFFAHWGFGGVPGSAPALWRNFSGVLLTPNDVEVGTSEANLDQRYNFVGNFVDGRNVGQQDLWLSSDFGTSAVLHNNADATYTVTTDREIINDENGMGSAIGDINNDGWLDWFVTSIFDPNGEAESNWGVSGNRLYLNNGVTQQIGFADISATAGVRDGNWGWGACMVDFNQDGFLDIFHVNGFGMLPESLRGQGQDEIIDLITDATKEFIGATPRLFINNGDQTFSEKSADWGLTVPSEGRGVICFDYDRDGDIDIGLLDHSSGIQFFENQIGHGPEQRFLNIRLVGAPPNTDALGAKVYVTADVGGEHGWQRQLRVSQANSNFNSQNLPDLHIGLGEAERAAFLRIEWPDNTGLICSQVRSNQFLVFDQRDRLWPKLFSDAPSCIWHPDIRAIISDVLAP